ncbi:MULTISPECIES: diacylglycerol kinase family protein [unclassified Nocardioides]|uniref:diacylglycerol kinase family protein n=1 Tax=unclassified Nocardioides TaxID=2615069 RepID=UPI0006FA3A49|nr:MULTISPECIES: diacylglycerol kinase family protein [unclassified Nocardioides]KRA37665.1 diacylglycerol kinase [Nocardioides sp. Root614]KRA91625.1 diacylglycerol kinase [Nocardioides sp. Root682]
MRSFSFLVNPLSGGGAAPAAVVPVARLLRDAGAEVEVTYSPGPRATLDLVRAGVARGDVIVAVGGDGMLSSIAGQVAQEGGVLGMVPAGRGNDFARMLKLSEDAEVIAKVLLTGEETPTDLIEVTLPGGEPRLVAGSVYSGVDARAGEIVDKVRWMPAKVQYPYAALHSLATYVPSTFRVVVDGEAHTFVAATVVVANSGYYGKGMHIAPSASVTDGVLDVIVIEAASRREMVKALPKVYDGSHIALDQVKVLRGTSVEISGTPSVPMGGDGEPLGMLPTSHDAPAVVRVLPGALKILT